MSNANKEKLVSALEKAGMHDAAERARSGYYSDFASPLATPLMHLVGELRKAGRGDLALRAMKGEFDHDR